MESAEFVATYIIEWQVEFSAIILFWAKKNCDQLKNKIALFEAGFWKMSPS